MNVRIIVLGAMRFACMLMLGMAGVQQTAMAAELTKLNMQELSQLLSKSNFTPFTVTKAWYGVDGKPANSIDVTSLMQSYAVQGVFPDPDVEVAKMRAAGTLSAAQKALPQDQAMNVFFGKDPKPGTKKVLHVELTFQNKNYVMNIAEWKKDRANKGNYTPLPTLGTKLVGDPAIAPATQLPLVATTLVPSAYPENKPIVTPAVAPVPAAAVVDPATIAWPANGVITLQQLGDALVKNALQPFTITDAWYGVQGNPNNLTGIVKAKLQDYADKGIFTIPKNMNKFFDKDPIKGTKKTLYIKFSMQGHDYEISIPEKKEDRGNYELPTARTIFAWGQGKTPGAPSVVWVQGDRLASDIANAIAGKPSALTLDSLSYEDHLNNAFTILGPKSNENDKNLFIKEVTYLVNNRALADADELDLLGALLKYARVPLSGDAARLAQIADFAKQIGVSLTASNLIDSLKSMLPLTASNKAAFVATGQKLVDMSKNNTLTYDEATATKGLLYAASLMIQNDQATVDAIKALDAAVMVPVAAAPGSTTPAVEQIATATAAPTTTQAPAPVTYADRIDAAMKIASFANDAAKDDFLTILEGLVADRARGSDDNLTSLQSLISYYSTLSPFFKDDARQARLKTMLTTLNSGITYADRLIAVDPLVKAATLSDGQKAEMFNILTALAKEQAKASATELSVARANLIVAGSKYTSDADKAALSSVESTFNTPPAPVAATSTTPDQAAGAAVSAQVVAAATSATTAAATGIAPVVPASPRYSDRLMNGFGVLVAAKTANTDEAIAAGLKLLSGLVDDRYLATGDDVKSLNMLIQYASMGFTDPKYADQIKTIAANAGTDIGFATKLQKFSDMLMNASFATSATMQTDALALANGLAATVDKTSQNDVINLKATLMAAQRLFSNPTDAATIQGLQQGLMVSTVSSNALPVATTAATAVDTTSFKSRVAAAAAVTTFAADADKDAFIKQLEGLVNDRARGNDEDIKAFNTVLDAASKNAALGQTYQDRIKGFIATMSRPIDSSERVAEQEEMTAITNISEAQLGEVVNNMTALAQNVANIPANDLVRIKSHIVVFAPKILNADYKKQFDAAKAVFDAPVQVVAPVAAAATGAQVPTAVTSSTAGAAAAAATSSRRVVPASRTRATVSVAQQITDAQKRLDAAKKSLATARTSAQKKSYQRQVDSYTAKLQALQNQQATAQPAAPVAATTAPAAVAVAPAAITAPVVPAEAGVAPVAPATETPAAATTTTAPAATTPAASPATTTPAAATTTTATVPATPVAAPTTTTPATAAVPVTTAPAVKLTPSQISVLKNRLAYYQKSVATLTSRLAQTPSGSASAKAMQGSIDRYNASIKTIQAQLGISSGAQ